MQFAIKQEAFSGPLGLLLNLLDKKELQIGDVQLATITEEYLHHLDTSDVPHEELADFLLVASRLIYLKSRKLMPYVDTEEEEAVEDLQEQLRVYRMFVDAAGRLEDMYAGTAHGFVQPFIRIKKQQQETRFIAFSNVSSEELKYSFHSVLKRLEPFFALQEASIERVKSVEERIEELSGAIRTRATLTFRDALKGAKSKTDVVVSFLALLELIRRQVVKASQKSDNDIVIEKL